MRATLWGVLLLLLLTQVPACVMQREIQSARLHLLQAQEWRIRHTRPVPN